MVMYAHHRSHVGLDGCLRCDKATWRAFFVSEMTLNLAVGQSREQEQRGHLRWWCTGAAVVFIYHRLSCQCSAPGEFRALLGPHMHARSVVSHPQAAISDTPSANVTIILIECLRCMLATLKGLLLCTHGVHQSVSTGMVKRPVCCNAVAQAAGAGWTWIFCMVCVQVPAVQGKQSAASLDSYSSSSVGY